MAFRKEISNPGDEKARVEKQVPVRGSASWGMDSTNLALRRTVFFKFRKRQEFNFFQPLMALRLKIVANAN